MIPAYIARGRVGSQYLCKKKRDISFVHTSVTGLKPVNLRDYQNPLAEKSLRGENDIILLPTGAGKTYIAIKIIIEHLHEYKDSKKLP